MSTQLGIISDPHASPAALEQALSIFTKRGIGTIICAGDIAGYFDTLAPTVELLQAHGVLCIRGNHDQAYLHNQLDRDTSAYRFLEQLPLTLGFSIEGKRIYMVHAQPPDELHGGIKLLDPDGDVMPERILQWQSKLSQLDTDILVVGHTHQVYAERIGSLLVVNPGSSVFNHSCMVLTLPELRVETFALENHTIVKCWNWSMFAEGQQKYTDN